jgi:hypothetical protein
MSPPKKKTAVRKRPAAGKQASGKAPAKKAAKKAAAKPAARAARLDGREGRQAHALTCGEIQDIGGREGCQIREQEDPRQRRRRQAVVAGPQGPRARFRGGRPAVPDRQRLGAARHADAG